MPKRFKNPLSNIANQFGTTVDSVLQPDFELHLGHVERVFPSNLEMNLYPGSLPSTDESPSQMVLLSSTTGLLPTMKKKFLARPLLRGVSDSITRGDLVLYTNITGKYFYLGPLNTLNSPNYSPDHTYQDSKNTDDENGYSTAYPKYPYPKLSKYPTDAMFTMQYDTLGADYLEAYSELDLLTKYTDLTLEGRHGNSIRIGSRREKPSINISNGRVSDPSESFTDGSNISLFGVGSLSQNLRGY